MAKDIEKKAKKEKKHFFKDFKAELKKVIWPTPKQVINNTVAVITIVLITAVIIFALDLVFKAINTYGINSIKSIVQKESVENTTDSEQQDAQSENETSTEATNESSVETSIDLSNATSSEQSTETSVVEEQSQEKTESNESEE